MFAECGSWKNFWDLEDCLSLDELLELYDIANERQIRIAKVMAAAMGADVSDDSGQSGGDNNYSPSSSLPFNLGYESIS